MLGYYYSHDPYYKQRYPSLHKIKRCSAGHLVFYGESACGLIQDHIQRLVEQGLTAEEAEPFAASDRACYYCRERHAYHLRDRIMNWFFAYLQLFAWWLYCVAYHFPAIRISHYAKERPITHATEEYFKQHGVALADAWGWSEPTSHLDHWCTITIVRPKIPNAFGYFLVFWHEVLDSGFMFMKNLAKARRDRRGLKLSGFCYRTVGKILFILERLLHFPLLSWAIWGSDVKLRTIKLRTWKWVHWTYSSLMS